MTIGQRIAICRVGAHARRGRRGVRLREWRQWSQDGLDQAVVGVDRMMKQRSGQDRDGTIRVGEIGHGSWKRISRLGHTIACGMRRGAIR